jgi:hypothetical protein
MLVKQEYACAICVQPIDDRAHVDHCHATGKIRGALCAQCNKGLGNFRDNIDHLKAAIKYLRKHGN